MANCKYLSIPPPSLPLPLQLLVLSPWCPPSPPPPPPFVTGSLLAKGGVGWWAVPKRDIVSDLDQKLRTQVADLAQCSLFHYIFYLFKWIVSRDFGWLQMILMNRTWVPLKGQYKEH